MTERELQLTLPATAENVIVVRQALAGLGEALGMASSRVSDLKTVVTEACNNVVVHAYDDAPGPLEVMATPGDHELEIRISDHGHGFRPRAHEGERSLGLGLPLIAALSDSFEISGGSRHGSTTTIHFAYEPAEERNNGKVPEHGAELAMQITPGEIVRPVLARVIGALAARAEFSVNRLADTVLIGDAVSTSGASEFADGQLGIQLKDGDGTLDVKVGPLVKGAGERLLDEMEVPGHGSLRNLANRMDVESGKTAEGQEAEFLVFEVAS